MKLNGIIMISGCWKRFYLAVVGQKIEEESQKVRRPYKQTM